MIFFSNFKFVQKYHIINSAKHQSLICAIQFFVRTKSCIFIIYVNLILKTFRSMKNVFNHLLAALCLVDLLVISTNIVFSLKILLEKPYPTFLSAIGKNRHYKKLIHVKSKTISYWYGKLLWLISYPFW